MADWQESRVLGKTEWNDKLFSLTFDADLLPFKAGQFIKVGLEVDGERIERPYSLVNAPDEKPGEIYFNLVDEGPLTNVLANIQPGDPIWVTRDAHGFLVLAALTSWPEFRSSLTLLRRLDGRRRRRFRHRHRCQSTVGLAAEKGSVTTDPLAGASSSYALHPRTRR